MASDSATNSMKSAADILAMVDTPEETIWVDAWQTNVKVIGLTKRQQLDIRRASLEGDVVNEEKVQQGVWLAGVKEPAFTEDQLGLLWEKSAGAIDLVLTKILELSGMTPEAVKKKEATFRS